MVSPFSPGEVQEITRKARQQLPLRARFHRFKKYRNTFLGAELVQWLVRQRYVATPGAAAALGTRMLELECIRHVSKKNKALNKSGCYVFPSTSGLEAFDADDAPQEDQDGPPSPLAREGTFDAEDTDSDASGPPIRGSSSPIELAAPSATPPALPVSEPGPRRRRGAHREPRCALPPTPERWRWDDSAVREVEKCCEELRELQRSLALLTAHQRRTTGWMRVGVAVIVAQYAGWLLGAAWPNPLWLSGCAITLLAAAAGAIWVLWDTGQLVADRPVAPAPTASSTGTSTQPVLGLKQFCEQHGLAIDVTLATSASVCFVLDVSTPSPTIAFASPGFLELTGFGKAELEGADCSALEGPATQAAAAAELRRLIAEGREGPVSVVHYRKGGAPFLDPLFLAPLPDAAGGVRYYLASQGAINAEASSTVSFPTQSSDSLDGMSPAEDEPAIAAHVPCTVPDPTQTALKIAVLDATLSQTTAVYYPNTGELVPFDTPAFRGVVHCRTRTPGDAYFAGKRRAFEIQLQGQFKRAPAGVVWFGAEVARPMALSRLKRMVCGVLLRLVAAFGHRAHVSFAESQIPGDVPHIVVPLLSAMDRVIVTPPGSAPPALGDNFPLTEAMTAIKALHSQPADFQIGPTYTMSFFSHYIDFERWAVVEIPGFGAVDLHGFWGDMPLRFVCYAHPADKHLHLVQERDPLVQFEIVHRSLPRYRDLPRPHYLASTPAQPERIVDALGTSLREPLL